MYPIGLILAYFLFALLLNQGSSATCKEVVGGQPPTYFFSEARLHSHGNHPYLDGRVARVLAGHRRCLPGLFVHSLFVARLK